MIYSLLLPTRKRPENLLRLYKSVADTATNVEDIEIIAYVDNDDPSYDYLDCAMYIPSLRILHGARTTISQAWNHCWESARGEYLGLVSDDIIFKTPSWDSIVLEKFQQWDDKIGYVFGDDGTAQGPFFGTHGFIHQNWANTVGYFLPPYFSANQVDRWLNEVAQNLGRLQFGEINMEHLHHAHGKAEFDETYQEAQTKFADNETIWLDTRELRDLDKEKLRKFIADFNHKL